MSADAAAYLDSSALVKLAVEEIESGALRGHLAGTAQIASSALARVEVPRAVRRYGQVAIDSARDVLRSAGLVPVTEAILDAAAVLDHAVLRSLDAIHVASALSMREVIAEVVTYDRRMAEAATAHGLTVVAPG
jgi:predicted nucleic acid-binding protein